MDPDWSSRIMNSLGSPSHLSRPSHKSAQSKSSSPNPTASFRNGIKLRPMANQSLNSKLNELKWGSSQTVKAGVPIITHHATASKITYPERHRRTSSAMPRYSSSETPFGQAKNPKWQRLNRILVDTNHIERKILAPIPRLPVTFDQDESSPPSPPIQNQASLLQTLRDLILPRLVDSSNIRVLTGCGFSFEIPVPIAYQSRTIQHIDKSSRNSFLEKGRIQFPRFSKEVLIDVLAYLFHIWALENVSYEERKNVPPYEPTLELTLELMMAGMYFELPYLVDRCSQIAAEHASSKAGALWDIGTQAYTSADIDTFGDLPRPALKDILSRMNIADMAKWELSREYALYGGITDLLWIKKFGKLFRIVSDERSLMGMHQALICSSFKTNLQKNSRQQCIQFYIQESLVKSKRMDDALCQFIKMEGGNVETLSLEETTLEQYTKNDWLTLLPHMPNIRQLHLQISGITNFILDILAILHSSLNDLYVDLVSGEHQSDMKALSKYTRNQFSKKGHKSYKIFGDTKTMAVNGVNHLMYDPSQDSIDDVLRHGVERQGDNRLHIRFQDSSALAELANLSQIFDSSKINSLGVRQTILHATGVTHLEKRISDGLLQSLRELDLSQTRIESGGWKELVPSLSCLQLESLDLSGTVTEESSSSLIIDVMKLLSKYLSSATCTLKSLNVSQNHISVIGIMAICDGLSRNSSLESIDMSQIQMKTALAYFTKCMHSRAKSFVRIDISDNQIIPRALNEFFQSFSASPKMGLRSLNINKNNFDASVLEALGSLLSTKSCSLRILKLSGDSSISNYNQKAINDLVESLREGGNLQELDVSSNGLSDDVCHSIARKLPNTKLQKLNLSHNKVTKFGLGVLQKASSRISDRSLEINLIQNYVYERSNDPIFSLNTPHLYYLDHQSQPDHLHSG